MFTSMFEDNLDLVDSFKKCGNFIARDLTSKLSTSDKIVNHSSTLIDYNIVIQNIPLNFQACKIKPVDILSLNVYNNIYEDDEISIVGHQIYSTSTLNMPTYGYVDNMLGDMLGASISALINKDLSSAYSYLRSYQSLATLYNPSDLIVQAKAKTELKMKNFRL